MSPEKRTYTIERGQKPGQVVLTPEKSPAKQVEYHGRSEFSTHNEGNTSQAELQKIESSNQTQIVPQGTSARDSLSKLVESARSVLKEISQCKIPNSSIKRQILHDKSGMCEENGSAMDITLGSQNISCSSNRNVRSPQLSSSNRSQVTIRLESPRASLSSRCIQSEDGKIPREPSNCLKLNGSQIVMTSKPAEMNQGEIPNTQHVDISVLSVANGEETVIPETQDFRTDTDNCITVQSSAKVVVIPVNQTFNTTLPDVPTKLGIRNSSENLHSTRTEMIHPPIQEHVDDATDNLRLTDIMTDDDEPTAVEMCVQNSSQTPMNLAANTNNVRAKRLRKRSLSRRRVQMERSQVMSTETETEQPPLALNNHMATRRRNPKKRQIPLNKAPGTPLNGERFAVELARMSNYEILDLRKRNSMGRVFPVNGRKSSRSKGQAIKKQIQLDDEIELELLKRNMETNKNDNHQCVTVSDVVEPEVYPPVPDEFRDALTFRGENISDSSLVDEKSCDRVSFVSSVMQISKWHADNNFFAENQKK